MLMCTPLSSQCYMQVYAEVHTHVHYYLVLASNGSVVELPGLTNMDLNTVQQVKLNRCGAGVFYSI